MDAKILTYANACDEQIRCLYESAFPKEEQIPYDDLLRLMPTMGLDFTAYYDEGEFVGFTIVYPRDTFNWFWYFAVREELRGKGYGQQILSLLIKKYKGCSNILDMESPDQDCDNAEQRRRRSAFYMRNGFRNTGVGKSFDGVDYVILSNGDKVFTMEDYEEVLAELRSFWSRMPVANDNGNDNESENDNVKP